jgi:hypothetical protein
LKGAALLRKRNKRLGLKRSEAEAVHLDNLLDEALRETFPASDPIAITIDKPSKVIAPDEGLRRPDDPSTAVGSQESIASWTPPIVSFYDSNLWALRQFSYFFDWWCGLLGGRK